MQKKKGRRSRGEKRGECVLYPDEAAHRYEEGQKCARDKESERQK